MILIRLMHTWLSTYEEVKSPNHNTQKSNPKFSENALIEDSSSLQEPRSSDSKHPTYLGSSSVPDDDFVSRVEQVLHHAASHDAQAEEAELHLAGLDVLLQESLRHVLQVQRGCVLRKGERRVIEWVSYVIKTSTILSLVYFWGAGEIRHTIQRLPLRVERKAVSD